MTDLLLLVACVLVSAWAIGYLGIYAGQLIYMILLIILATLVLFFVGRHFKSTVQSFRHDYDKKNNPLRDSVWRASAD